MDAARDPWLPFRGIAPDYDPVDTYITYCIQSWSDLFWEKRRQVAARRVGQVMGRDYRTSYRR